MEADMANDSKRARAGRARRESARKEGQGERRMEGGCKRRRRRKTRPLPCRRRSVYRHAISWRTVCTALSWLTHGRARADLALLALSVGMDRVPVYALVPLRSVAPHRARLIAALNILNALFIVGGSVLAGALLAQP